jgi:hypothetical protein
MGIRNFDTGTKVFTRDFMRFVRIVESENPGLSEMAHVLLYTEFQRWRRD